MEAAGDLRRANRSMAMLVLLLSVVSTTYVAARLIVRFAPERIAFVRLILTDHAESPYQYRVFKPLVGEAIGHLLTPFVGTPIGQHIAAYSLISFLAFLGLYASFGLYLRHLFSEKAALLGLALLQVVIPLSVTGFYMEGDFITAAFYAFGLLLMVLEKDAYLPLLIGIATLNREQMIFLVVLYGAWLVTQQRLSRRTVAILVSCVIAYAVVFVGLRLGLGFKPSRYTAAYHIAANTSRHNLLEKIVPLWLGEVGGFVLMSIIAFRRSNRFFRVAFLILIPYVVMFFLNGLLWETGKFLPAFLVLIPMALQLLVDEFPQSIPRRVGGTGA
jgi:hypothetical protein